MSRRLIAMLVGLAVWIPPLGEATACAAHMVIFFDRFSPEAASRPLYWTVEGTGGTTGVPFRVRLFGGDCGGNPVSATLSTEQVTPNAGDYIPQQAEVVFTNTGAHADYQDFELSVNGDVPPDPGLEVAMLRLSNPKNGVEFAHPSSAPVIIVDDDGPTGWVSLLDGEYRHPENRPQGGIPVFRGGSVAVPTSVQYTIAPDPSAAPSEGADYKAAASGTLQFEAGARVKMIPISVLRDGVRESDERLKVTIAGTEVTGPAGATFTIVDAAGAAGPVSSLHHPKQKVRYRSKDYRIREIHIFTRGTGGMDVISAQFALRANLKGGRCAWLQGKRFRKGPCGQERWLSTKTYEADFFYYRMRVRLKPTKGRVRTYTAFSRAVDRAGQIEVALEKGRNANTFKIKRTKKRR